MRIKRRSRVGRLGPLVAVPLLGTVIAGCSDNGIPPVGAGPTIPVTVSPDACSTPPALNTGSGIQHYAAVGPVTLQPTTYVATIITNCGTIIATMDSKHAPANVRSLLWLTGRHFFDDSSCGRLTSAQADLEILQCGQSTGGGTGSPGYTVPAEDLAHATYPTGTIAMAAKSGEFFFVYGPSPRLDRDRYFTPVGRVTSGLDVLQRIAAAGSTPPSDGAPNQPVVIESFTLN
jgi:peptidyl-prolyl cis-trans isomerase B (cyclophilin B)